MEKPPENTIIWSLKAAKQLRKLDPQHQKPIRDGVETLKGMPDCTNIKQLKGETYGYRLRVGNFRVMFDFDGKVRIVSIQEVKLRNEQTY